MAIKYLKSAKLAGKTVIVRADVNSKCDENGKLRDDYRIRQVIPTIEYLRSKGAKVILTGHIGRPQGKWNEAYTMQPVAKRFAELLKLKFIETDHEVPNYRINHVIFFTGDLQTEKARKQIIAIPDKDIVILENLRFYKGEDENSPVFGKQLASLADIYVNDGFGVCHRKAASVVAITKYLPSYAGLLLEKEIKALNVVIRAPKKPFVVMVGGIKISDKAETLKNLGKRADKILVGGGIANLMLLAKGYGIGLSKVEREELKLAWQIERNFHSKLVLPKDLVVANKNIDKSSIRVASSYDVKKNEIAFDLGPKSILEYATILKSANTIVWGGPLGYFERKPFDTATMALARVIGGVSKRKAFGVVGGGETVDAVRKAQQDKYIDHVSTGGGAMLEFLANKKMPGLEALER